MADIFLKEDIYDLLLNKFVVIIGDSIQRAVYKDVVLLLQANKYLTDEQLRKKGELNFEGDELIEGGRKGVMSNGISYREVRQYQTHYHLIRFYFVTRCYNTYVESILSDLSKEPEPDVIIINSCLWDISRYGANSIDDYKKNLDKLFTRFNEVLPKHCLVIWNTTMPISKSVRGGFMVPEVEFMNSTLRLDILEANFFARRVVVAHGYDVLDLHYYLRHQLHRRVEDGVHWDMTAHRRITNLLLSHVSEAWNKESPGNYKRFLTRTQNDKSSEVIEKNRDILRQKENSWFNINPYLHQFQITANDEKKIEPTLMTLPELMGAQCKESSQYQKIRNRPYQDQNLHSFDDQADNIRRYGGPIHKSSYVQPTFDFTQFEHQPWPESRQWQPYASNDFNPVSKRVTERGRHNPYSSYKQYRSDGHSYKANWFDNH
ncbi:hypothetical protein CHS0354_006115 [Potamilus streckersoni]|uniref:PC-esterase domain-containing protein 1A n=1 Tax=Potamilus streckersoni TaxID=2493646 RepID=A0AAE0STD9_9BIVA|nr:hypothetical protein CHS0354_006115 [Potamilus streckersoni]